MFFNLFHSTVDRGPFDFGAINDGKHPYPPDQSGYVPTKFVLVSRPKEISNEEAKNMYDSGLALFRTKKYADAEVLFLSAIQNFPESDHLPYLRYWLGYSYYAQYKYTEAISEGEILLKTYPNFPNAAEVLLNIASSHRELRDNISANKTFEQILDKFPDSPAAKVARSRIGG